MLTVIDQLPHFFHKGQKIAEIIYLGVIIYEQVHCVVASLLSQTTTRAGRHIMIDLPSRALENIFDDEDRNGTGKPSLIMSVGKCHCTFL